MVEPTACMDRAFMSMLIILYIFLRKNRNIDLLADACSRGVDWIVFKAQDFLFFTAQQIGARSTDLYRTFTKRKIDLFSHWSPSFIHVDLYLAL